MANQIKSFLQNYSVKDFEKQFSDDDAILEWLKDYRWPDGIHCPACDSITKHHRIKSRPCYKCDRCGHDTYPTAGTIFHKSTTPLKTWFEAMYWMATDRSGQSAKNLQRKTGVTYKTAWRMFNNIKALLSNDSLKLIRDMDAGDIPTLGTMNSQNSNRTSALARQGQTLATNAPDKIKPATPRRMSKDPYKSKMRRQEIVESVAKMVVRHPSGLNNLDDIAKKAGKSKGQIYYYFKSKSDMLYQMQCYSYDLVEEAISPILLDKTKTPRQRLQALLCAHMTCLCQHWQIWRSLWLDIVLWGGSLPQRKLITRRRRAYDRTLANLLEEVIQAENLNTPIAPNTVARMMINLMNSVSRWYRKGGKLSAEEVTEYAVNCALCCLDLPNKKD